MVKPSVFLTRCAKPDARSKKTHAGCRLGHLGWLIRSLGGCRSPDPPPCSWRGSRQPLPPGQTPTPPPEAQAIRRTLFDRRCCRACQTVLSSWGHQSSTPYPQTKRPYRKPFCHIPFRFTISMEAPHSGYRDDYPGTQHRISPNHPRMQRHGGGRGEACLDTLNPPLKYL